MVKKRQHHFATHAELKNVIGQDLINDDNIALVELVKNGIDAGASQLKISFYQNSPGEIDGPAIIIEDDGSGMNEDDIEKKWLNIAYSEKKENPVENGRIQAGNKGVGRFACDRLGAKLDMYTRRRGDELLHLSVNWSNFENKKLVSDTIQKFRVNLDEVAAEDVRRRIGRSLGRKGTILVVTNVRREWTRDHLLTLKRTLQRFVNPISVFDKSGVEIYLDAPDELEEDNDQEPHLQVNGLIENQVFENLKFKTTYIDMTLDKDGETLNTELHHEGQQVYRLVEKRADYAPLKGVRIVLHYMNPYKKAYFKRQTGIHLVDFGSIFLFVNGYRVSPYGDRDNDWLQLDNRKGQGKARHLGTREVLGIIGIDDAEKGFRIVSNREGVVRNAAFSKLTARQGGLIFTAVTRLERFVVEGLKWDSVPDHVLDSLRQGVIPGKEVYDESNDAKRRRIALDVLKIVGASQSTTLELQIDPEILDSLSKEREEEVRSILEKFDALGDAASSDMKGALRRVQDEFERQKNALSQAKVEVSRKGKQVERLKAVARKYSATNANLELQIKTQQTELLFSRAASGTDKDQLMLLHHQSGLSAASAKNFLERGLVQLQKGDLEKAKDLFGSALNSTKRTLTISRFATKANFHLKAETMTADLAVFVSEYLLNVAKETSAHNLELKVIKSFEGDFVLRFKPIDIAIVFDNIASNSDKVGAKELVVEMSRPAQNELLITVSDDGPGLSPEIQPPESIFQRGVTTTVNGSGLGLYHVRDTITKMGGSIFLEEGPRFCLRIRLFK